MSRPNLKEQRRKAAAEHAELLRQALAGLQSAQVEAEQHGIHITVRESKRGTPHVTFKLRRFHVGDWWPSTNRLMIGSIDTRAATINEALNKVVEYAT